MLDPLLDTSHLGSGGVVSSLGREYLLTDSDHLIAVGPANSGLPGSSGPPHPPSSGHTAPPTTPTTASPTSTLVGSSKGLEIDLIWDSSVRDSANWAAIEAAVVAAATIYTDTFSNHIVINIEVGYGEIDGSAMSSNALGESESYGYITNYSTVESHLNAADAGLISSGLLSSNALSADSPPTGANFFVTSAEAKALGLISGSSTALDGYIGISSSSSLMYFPANGGTIGASQYDAVGVAAHEIGEVMGRIGLEGQTLSTYNDVYTPLDLFRYTSSPGVRDLTPTTGYFSVNDGVTDLNTYNNPTNGGDAADWATLPSNSDDAYDAFGNPGVITQVTATDLLEEAVLGYALDPGLTLEPVTA